MRAAKFFRYLWRVNAVVIFLATAGIVVAVAYFTFDGMTRGHRELPAGPDVVKEKQEELRLGNLAAVAGTNVLQANLTVVDRKSSFSSYDGSDGSDGGDIRNVLTLDATTGAAKWMFPTHAQVIRTKTLEKSGPDSSDRAEILDVRFARPIRNGKVESEGRLIVSDPSAARVVTIAEHVNDLDDVTLVNGNAVIVCQRGNHYVLISVNPVTLAKIGERTVDIPKL